MKIKITARSFIGPLNVVVTVRLPRATEGRNILLRDGSKLAIEIGLDGLSGHDRINTQHCLNPTERKANTAGHGRRGLRGRHD
jgi:hypothetical protein